MRGGLGHEVKGSKRNIDQTERVLLSAGRGDFDISLPFFFRFNSRTFATESRSLCAEVNL